MKQDEKGLLEVILEVFEEIDGFSIITAWNSVLNGVGTNDHEFDSFQFLGFDLGYVALIHFEIV